MNQGKLDAVKQEIERVNIDILVISELKWMEWVNLIQMTIISTTTVPSTLATLCEELTHWKRL